MHTDTLYNMFIVFFTILCIPADKLHGCELLFILFKLLLFIDITLKLVHTWYLLINMNFTYQKSC